MAQPVVDLLCQVKEDDTTLSIPALIKLAREYHPDLVSDEVVLAESTVDRLLSKRGLMKKRPEDPTSKDRRRFQREQAGDQWMSDVMHGPKIRHDGQHRQNYLIAVLDEATRMIPFATFAFLQGRQA